jgi:hypothetical protein
MVIILQGDFCLFHLANNHMQIVRQILLWQISNSLHPPPQTKEANIMK